MNSVVDQPWFVVDAPHGDGTWVIAGNADPSIGTFVCACLDDERADRQAALQAGRAAAAHIVKTHNTDLARRVVERKMGVRD